MFDTSIHWTTFFYLLVDTFIVLIVSIRALNLKRPILKRYLILGLLFIAYNLTGGFMPIEEFPAPLILQYTITYSVAIILCVYLAHYLYKEYDIAILRVQKTGIVYHLGRIKVSIGRRGKVSHLGRGKVNH